MTNQNNLNNQELLIGVKIANNQLPPEEILKIQLEVAYGNMLGDGSLITDAVKNAPTGFSMQLTSKERQYIDHLYNIYKPWTTAKIYDKKKGRKNMAGEPATPNWAFITRVQKVLLSYGNWRDTSRKPTRKKLPPREEIEKSLTPRALAYWFMDDGCYATTNSKGLFLCTDGFTKEETLLLCDILKDKYQIICYERYISAKDQYRIFISARSHDTIKYFILPYMLPCFMYKINR